MPAIRCVPVILGCAALSPQSAMACTASTKPLRFDALECLELRADPRTASTGTVLLNHCQEPIAMLVVVCDLAAQPACKADPMRSKGWRPRGDVEYVAPARTNGSLDAEYVAPARTSAGSRDTAGAADRAQRVDSRLPSLTPYAPSLQKGQRAQIAACRLNLQSPRSQDPCVLQLEKLKRSVDASDGKSMRAALADLRRRCSI